MRAKVFTYLLIVGGTLIIMALFPSQQEEKFYYAFDEKITLIAKANTILVKYVEGIEKTKAVESIERLSPDFNIKWHGLLTAEISTASQKSAEELMAKLKQDDEVYTCQPFYTLKDGLDMGVADEILVRFLPEVTEEQQKELQTTFDVKVVKTTKIYQKLRVSKGEDALDIANKYYESGLVEFATPNFISYAELHQIIPNDTYFNRQITCHNTGQVFTDGHSGTNDADIDAPEAWGITTGCSNIVIAVLDEGVTSNHPDLPNTRQIRLDGSNFGDGNANDPSPTGNMNHGNACAGVIAATMNNSEGIAGIAPNCRIMPIRIFNSDEFSVNPDKIADAIEFAVNNGAHILSNSWGYWTSDQNAHPVIVTAINYAVTNNRVVIFSAGNTADHHNGSNGYVTFPANVNISSVITVGASDRNDNQANYSPTSSLIDIVAPSHRAYPDQITGETLEMWSIDIPGNTGYNPWPPEGVHPPVTGEILPDAGTNNLAYTARFGGTSHACPVIAGVAALMLSVNPDLSNQDVFNLLTSQARNVGGFTYVNGRCNEMGHGRVDAFASVRFALDIGISGPFTVCSSGSTFTIDNLPSVDSILWEGGPYLTITSGQNTSSCTFVAAGNGESWVTARLVSDCGSVTIPHHTVWAGVPDYDLLSVYLEGGALVACDYTSATANYDGSAGIDAFEWYMPNASDWNIEEESGAGPDNKYVEIEYRDDPPPSQEDIYIRAHNSCGWSLWKGTFWSVVDRCGWYLIFSPDSGTGGTKITIASGTAEKSFAETTEWNLEIYNQSQLLKEKKIKLKGNSTVINTSGWQEGVYTVQVKFDNEVLTDKLLIKR